jgi:hypothetical protein
VVIAGRCSTATRARPLFVGSRCSPRLALLGVEREMSYARWLAHAALRARGSGSTTR